MADDRPFPEISVTENASGLRKWEVNTKWSNRVLSYLPYTWLIFFGLWDAWDVALERQQDQTYDDIGRMLADIYRDEIDNPSDPC